MAKSKFGIRNLRYAVVDDEGLVDGEVKQIKGMTAAKMELKNEMKSIAADDAPFEVLSGGISEATLDLKVWDFDSEVKKDWFGIEIKKGVEIYNKNLTPKDICIMFDTKHSNGSIIHFAMLKGKFSLPGFDGKTVDGVPDPTEDEVTGTFAPRGNGDIGEMVAIGREENEGFDAKAFESYVFAKTADDLKALDTVTPSEP